MKALTKLEQDYLDIMSAQYLVLNLIGSPGTAKSAIIKSIADKIGAEFIDLRLPCMDEVDLGVYPNLKDSGKGYKIKADSVPEWADMTTDLSKKFIIVFEELNRASKAVRDSALGLLLERRIGPHFVFGSNVLMCATGNLGTEDGTEVEEFDTALKSRLITIHHDMPLDVWIDSYGKEHVHPDIIRYLTQNPTHFYPDVKKQDADGRVIVNPRTWTGLSKFIEHHFGKTSGVDQYGGRLDSIAKHYIGSYGLSFLKWLRENSRITLVDILDAKLKEHKSLGMVSGTSLVKRDGSIIIDKDGKYSVQRDNLNEICSELKEHGILNVNLAQMKNIMKLLNTVDTDVKYGAIWDFIRSGDHDGATQTEATKFFVKEYKSILNELVKKNEELNQVVEKK